ncbi:MAG: hypothetical protein IH840_05350, partial [Candidatus Heimdallarchaeota archaeon]|nr:hypothetical protein [Candidatus Heimdallarchaeota archaeon]
KGAVGVIAVFDIVDQKSFDDIRNWIQNFINSTGQNDIPLLIIGNKIDLEKTSSNYITAENQLAFTKELISTENYNFQVSSIRSSAKTGENVYPGILEFSSLILDWIKNKQQDNTFQKIIPDDRFRNFPVAYIFCMNQVQGPIVIATSAAPDLELGDEKVSAVKLISSFDYEDIISNLSVTGTYTWQKPLGIFYYITFIVENLKARGGNELYVIGINADKELTNVLAGLKGLIDGFLHKAMNDFRKFTLEQNINFVINAYSPVEGSSITKGIRATLAELRDKIHESVLKWYNIT